MTRILVVGASGLLGNNCFRHFSEQEDFEVAGTYFSFEQPGIHPYDTLNPDAPGNFDVRAWQPDVILHTGALTWVDYCEENPDESYEKTVVSTKNLVALSKELGARMVYVSTDYVFDGKAGPYTEDAAVKPLSVYARHKLEAEELVLDEVPGALAIRITNVYGDEARNKNFIARLADQFKEGKKLELRLPLDQYATPANAWDIARALALLIRDSKQGVYHIAGTDWVSRVQLAQRVLKYFPENESTIEPITTAELNPPADRPLLGGLVAAKFLAEYPGFVFSNVDDYLTDLVC